MKAVVEWGVWGAHFLLWFALVALVEGASYWILRAPWKRLHLVRELGVYLYLVLGAPILCCVLFNDVALGVSFLCALVFFSVLQTILENAILPRNLDWRDQFYLSLLTHYYSLCNGVVFVIVLAVSLSPHSRDTPFGEGVLMGLWLTPVSISFFRWMLPQLRMRPGVDRSLDESEPVRRA